MKTEFDLMKAEFDRRFDECIRETLQAVREFPWEDARAYASWLAQTYHFVRHSTNLLALKASKYSPEQPERHRNALLHLKEESGHDKLLLNDLKALHREISEFPEMIEISLFYQSQYYWLDHQGPIPFTGYALMLEEMAAREGEKVIRRILSRHDRKAASFLLVHAKADLEHTQLQRREFDGAQATDLEKVLKNVRQCAYLYHAMLVKITRECRTVEPVRIAA